MKLLNLLKIINETAKEINASKPYIVGGMVRDIVLKNYKNVKDVDITCGDETSDLLGQAVLKKLPEATYVKFSDGHGCLNVENFKIDFSNNFLVPNIEQHLNKIGIIKPTFMEKEIFSRDFTINTLLIPLDLTKIYDITKKGTKDIKNKIIDTCLEPEITLGSHPQRIIRIVYLGVKLDFQPSERVTNWVYNNSNIINNINKKYITNKINKSIKKNPQKTFELLQKLNLLKFIPMKENYIDNLINNPKALYKSLR